ncbi:conserved hypothetical protein [Sinorhizobium medicae]|uniref:Uncharacterized protein n=1 Tax=Sinorhizobium medicae TaxID=110321 RepID=A0A508X1V0_9HYPH|nr:conserved hypothetical protein [Sinorhizobium medicae]
MKCDFRAFTSRKSQLTAFPHASLEERKFRFMFGIRGLLKIFNNLDTPCQSESEFVNHLMAASKSGNDWIRIA